MALHGEAPTTPTPPAPVRTVRCDEVVLQMIVREYIDGVPVGEATLKPEKVFRRQMPDLWASVDETVAQLKPKTAAPQP